MFWNTKVIIIVAKSNKKCPFLYIRGEFSICLGGVARLRRGAYVALGCTENGRESRAKRPPSRFVTVVTNMCNDRYEHAYRPLRTCVSAVTNMRTDRYETKSGRFRPIFRPFPYNKLASIARLAHMMRPIFRSVTSSLLAVAVSRRGTCKD